MKHTLDLALFPWHEPVVVRWSDFDMLGHANNALYSTYIENARIHYLRQLGPWPWEVTGMVLARTEMDFVRELKPQNHPEVYMRVSRIGTKSLDFETFIVERDDPTIIYNWAKIVVVAFDKASKETVAVPAEMREKFLAFEPGLAT